MKWQLRSSRTEAAIRADTLQLIDRIIPPFPTEKLMCEIKAKAKLHDHELTDVPVLNPGDWFGKTWLIEIGRATTPRCT